MEEYINKAVIKAEIERLISNGQVKLQESQESNDDESYVAWAEHIATCIRVLSFLDTLEVEDPYEQCVQYDSIKAGIQAHAETYSFNIESQLFPQLTKEQQALWRKEIEQAVISGGDAGVTLARDQRYKENLEGKEEVLDSNDKTKLMQKCVHKAYKRGYDMGVLQTTNKMNHNTKEVDLDIEVALWANAIPEIRLDDVKRLAKYFYELGLKAQKL